MITLYIIICHKKKGEMLPIYSLMPYLLYGNTPPPPPPHTHDTRGFKTIWVPTHRGTLYPKREEKSVWGEVGVTKEAGKRKVVSWIHSLGLLVDDG